MKRIVVVDDSEYMRELLSRLIALDGDMQVVGTAADPYEARQLIRELDPDAITLDVEMPKMDGLSFLRNVMRLRPVPVVLVSSLVGTSVEVAVEALAIGAVDVQSKPTRGETQAFGEQLRAKLRVAASLSPDQLMSGVQRASAAPPPPAPPAIALPESFNLVVGIGASTGGTTAIKEVLRALPADFPPVLITQHIPAQFSAPFAASANRQSALEVVEARDGQPLRRGCAYVAPGDQHLELRARDGRYVCRLRDGDKVNGHRPSVDVMFDSMVKVMGRRLVAVLLTGMGADGARGLRRIREVGGYTLAQDEATSVVWGMPGEAVKRDAACKVLPLQRIASVLSQRCGRHGAAAGTGARPAAGDPAGARPVAADGEATP